MRKTTSAIISTAVMMSCWAAGSEKNMVYAGDYSIGIEMESQEIPINLIEKDRAVYVPVKINGNPGVTSLYFAFEYDEKFEEYMSAITYHNSEFEKELMSYSNGNDNYAGIIGGVSEDNYLDINGLYCALKLKLPENYAKDGEEYTQDCFWYTDASSSVRTNMTSIFTEVSEGETLQNQDEQKGSSEIPVLAAAAGGGVLAGLFAALKNKKTRKGKK